MKKGEKRGGVERERAREEEMWGERRRRGKGRRRDGENSNQRIKERMGEESGKCHRTGGYE